MKTFLKIVGGLVLIVIALIAGVVIWLSARKPASRPASTEKIEATPERLARGTYLVEHVADCLGCHSDHIIKFGIPVKPGTEGEGGYIFDEKIGFPGVVAAQNLTADQEFGLGKWTDGEIIRAIREGIDRNGEALFPMMPYEHMRSMSDDDVKSVVVYLRTLKPIHKGVPAKHINFPVNLFVKFVPKPVDGVVPTPDPHDNLAYGKYLSTIGGCYECHTPHDDKGTRIADKAYSGGWEMKGPWGRNFTANLTSTPGTYMAHATKEEFIGRFKAFASMNANTAPDAPAGRNTVMPWLAFSQMTEQDLGALYDYLKTVKPIENKVVTFPDAK
ncbi:MAG TPA: cytochrome C [Thermoanaerobaculia bacterium]|nr:cytochrome C [Thermoanaerobaculia bacterium]